MRAALALFVLLAPSSHALAVLDRVESDGSLTVRVALDEGDLVGRVVHGAASADGRPLSADLAPLGSAPRAWEGFPRTVLLELSGNGSVLLADDASGVVLAVRPASPRPSDHTAVPDHTREGSPAGNASGPGASTGVQGPAPSTTLVSARIEPALDTARDPATHPLRLALVLSALLVAGLGAAHAARSRRRKG